jgi:hypothetical protein
MKAASTQMQTQKRLYTVPSDLQWPERMKIQSMTYLNKYDSCTQSILWSFMEALGMENRMVLRAGGAMQGGMMSSMTCGVHTAGLMILGLLVGREKLESGLDGMMPIIMPAQRMVRKLTEGVGGHSCLAMTGVDFTDLEAAMIYKLSEDHERCVERVGNGARIIAELLQDLDRKGELFRV